MPDFSACEGKGCEKKEKCCRYLMVWETYQTVTAYDPKTCESFWDVKRGAPFELRKPLPFAAQNMQEHHDPKGGICEGCRNKTLICEHHLCAVCSCGKYCWLD